MMNTVEHDAYDPEGPWLPIRDAAALATGAIPGLTAKQFGRVVHEGRITGRSPGTEGNPGKQWLVSEPALQAWILTRNPSWVAPATVAAMQSRIRDLEAGYGLQRDAVHMAQLETMQARLDEANARASMWQQRAERAEAMLRAAVLGDIPTL